MFGTQADQSKDNESGQRGATLLRQTSPLLTVADNQGSGTPREYAVALSGAREHGTAEGLLTTATKQQLLAGQTYFPGTTDRALREGKG
ncbi:hypothetical protein HaLaN_10483, partial [Haematococcus lacustris]